MQPSSQWTTTGINTEFSNEQAPEKQIRWNPNIPYAPIQAQPFSPRHEILFKAVDRAIKNGWKGWRFHVNDAVTVGMEADHLVRYMIRTQKPLEPLIYNKDFARALWGDTLVHGDGTLDTYKMWEFNMMRMSISDDPLAYIGSTL
jgi:hypothetical protein